jgi:hypothetical protein
MHWPYRPYPSGYDAPGIGFFAAMFAIVLGFVVFVLFVVNASGRLPEFSEQEAQEESETPPNADNAQVPPGTLQSVAGDGSPR